MKQNENDEKKKNWELLIHYKYSQLQIFISLIIKATNKSRVIKVLIKINQPNQEKGIVRRISFHHPQVLNSNFLVKIKKKISRS